MLEKFFANKFKVALFILCLFHVLLVDIAAAEKSEFARAVDFVKEKNYADAYAVFAKLSELNDHDAQFNAAILLRKGLGHPANYKLALKWVS